MENVLEKLLTPGSLEKIKQAGLHRVIGTMNGVEEMGIKEAVTILAAKSYMLRKEATLMADGIRAYRALRGEKVADAMAALDALGAAGMRALPVGIGGALLGRALNQDPSQADQSTMLGGAAGMAGGTAANLFRGLSRAPGAASEIAGAIRGL